MAYQVPILGNICERCGHDWRQRTTTDKPKVCPACKSPYWNDPRRIVAAPPRQHTAADRTRRGKKTR